MYRAASPYGGGSPMLPAVDPAMMAQGYPPPAQPYPQSPYQAAGPTVPPQQDIQPGSTTYTTSQGPNGLIYHPFKAVAASYQTQSGLVSGIQWVPIEATLVMPTGAQPATADFAAMWQRGGNNPDMTPQDARNLKDWQRREEKQRRREEKESKRQLREKDMYSTTNNSGEDSALQKAREKDAHRAAERERKKSFNAPTGYAPQTPGQIATSPSNYPASPYGATASGPNTPYSQGSAGSAYAAGGYPFPGTPAVTGGYPTSSGVRGVTGGQSLNDVERHMNDMDLSGSREFEREKSLTRPKKYAATETMAERTRRVSGNYGAAAAASPYGNPNATGTYPPFNSAVAGGYGTAQVPGGYPPAAVAGGYPSSNLQQGAGGYSSFQPTDPQARSRVNTPALGSQSPLPGAYPPTSAVEMGEAKQLPTPEGFNRPPNQSQGYTPFETMKIQDMDEFFEVVPRMPLVMQTHDTYHEDWIRVMQDISLAWAGRLPVPTPGRYPKRSTLTSELIELWNSHFFHCRGVDMVLYKGRERRSGQHAGVVDLQFTDDNDSESSSETSSSESEEGGDGYGLGPGGPYGAGGGAYGRQSAAMYGPSAESLDARRRRREKKMEKKRRRKEKKADKRRRRREKTYALYLTYIPPTPSPLTNSSIPAPGFAPLHGVTPGY